jgi:elongation factor G
MKTVESKLIRNVALIGHGQAGKTTLAEALLFAAGAITRQGTTAAGNTTMDVEPEEIKRRASISAGLAHLEWKKHRINLVDTLGDANFFTDTLNCLAAVDAAVLVVCAASGIEVQTEKAWDRAVELGLPTIVFVNKMNRERADFDAVLAGLHDVFGINPMPLQVPIGKEAGFKGVVDVLARKAYAYAADGTGKFAEGEVPADVADVLSEYRGKAIDAIADTDEELMVKVLEDQEIPTEELVAGLKSGVASGKIVPVLCGASDACVGTAQLLDLIVDALPSPLDRAPILAEPVGGGDPIAIAPDPAGPLSALVFKTVIDPFAGKLNIARIWSGKLDADSTFYNASQDLKERIAQPLKIFGKKTEGIDGAVTGEIVALQKLKETRTGDTIAAESRKVRIKRLVFFPPPIAYALQPRQQSDEAKISTALQRLLEEDPTLEIRRDEQTHQILLAGMGQGHIELSVEKMRRKFGVELDLTMPRVPYKETIRKPARDIEGKHKKQTGGRGQFGVCYIDAEPLPRGGGFEFADNIVGGSIPRQYIPAVEKGVRERMAKGAVAGFPIVDAKVRLFDGKFHEVDSSEMAFKIAGSLAFKNAVIQADPYLLEPIMDIEITVPDSYTGDIMGDLNSRRGRVSGIDAKGKFAVVRGQVPMAEILRYEPDLRSITSGKGFYVATFSHYEELPSHLAQKVIAESKMVEEEE